MFRCRNLSWVGLLILALGQSSCVESEHPLVAPEKSELDKQLIGTWKSADPKEKDEGTRVAPSKDVKNAPAGLIELQGLKAEPGKDGKPDKRLYAFCAPVGKEQYFHLIVFKKDAPDVLKEWKGADVQSYMICKYTIAGDRFTLWPMDPDATAALIKDGKLKGTTVKKGAFCPILTLQESSEGLRKILEDGGSKTLFLDKDKVVLDRVKS